MGIELDCYFTLEERRPDEGTSPGALYNRRIAYLNKVSSIDQLVEHLSRELGEFSILRSIENPAVVHIVSKALPEDNSYVMEKVADLSFSGRLSALPNALTASTPQLGLRRFVGDHELWDCTTEVKVRARKASVRRILTDWLPLSEYERVLWVAESYARDDMLRTEVLFRGPMPLEEGLEGVSGVDFELGQVAYRRALALARPQDIEKVVAKAVEFIRPRMEVGRTSQVRWAMLVLGRLHAEMGIEPLIRYIDYQYTTCPLLEETYPAVRALIWMGEPAADAALVELNWMPLYQVRPGQGVRATIEEVGVVARGWLGQSIQGGTLQLRRRLLCHVVLSVYGWEGARNRLGAMLGKAEGRLQRHNLQAAMKLCETEEK
jgi:hypothetical protein